MKQIFPIIGFVLGSLSILGGFWWKRKRFEVGIYGMAWLIIGMFFGFVIAYF